MVSDLTDTISGVELTDNKYSIVEGNVNFVWRIDDSQGNTKLRFDMEEGESDGYHIKNSNDELIGILGDQYDSEEIPANNEFDGNYAFYSTIDDELIATISLSWTTGAKMTYYDSSKEVITVDVNNLRRLYAVFGQWPINALLTRKWKFSVPDKGQIGTLEENNSFNPLSKPTNDLNLQSSSELTELEKFGTMAIGTIAVYD